jgi:dienelactone hydrolase
MMAPSSPAEVALSVLELARAGQFAQIRDMFAPPLQALVPPEALRAAWAAELGRRGPVTAVGAPVAEPAGPGGIAVKIPVTFQHGTMTVAIGVAGEQNWLTGVQLLPGSAAEPVTPWQPPPYADPATFTETAITLGDGPAAVPGALSLPRRDAPVPGVVLLAGSGPQDRDGTIGRSKPLRDLAWGLASAGVAVLRFDKITFARPGLAAASPAFTLSDEYLPQALAGIGLLGRLPAVDPARVFVAGHSLGGTVAPRVAAAGPPVAGLVILAGGAEPLHRAAVRQFRYLAALEPGGGQAGRAVLEVITRQARAVDDPGLSASTPASELPFGVPAAYWLDLRGYDPATAAAELGAPMLIVQGGRDYQVTVADDLSRWQAALGARPQVTIRVYPADNHLFFPGSGPSSPAEYEPAQHVDPAVIADVAAWLTGGQPDGPSLT